MDVNKRIERNQDAIFRIEARDDLDFWHQQRMILWHQSRIAYWLHKLSKYGRKVTE